MKVAIITDQHFGARNDSVHFLDFYEKFYRETFFPTLEENDVKRVYILGDTFDRRKYVNFYSLKRTKEMFFDPLAYMGIDVHILAGNHDTYYKNTNDVNSIDLMLREYSNVNVISSPQTLDLNGVGVCMVPWICTDNYEQTMEVVKRSNAQAVFGHFEFAGFEMYRGHKNDHGMDTKSFDKFPIVCSGHFHHRSRSGNIVYLGNTYEFTWSDYNDPRGYHIYDTETNEIEFYENPNRIFHKVYYDDSNTDPNNIDLTYLKESCVRLVVVKKTDFYKFDMFVDKLYNSNLIELKIMEDFSEFESDANDDENFDVEDTMSILEDYVEAINTDLDKVKIKSLLRTLYVEAQSIVP